MKKHDELRTYTKFQYWLATNYNNLPTTSGEMTERAIKYLQEIKQKNHIVGVNKMITKQQEQ